METTQDKSQMNYRSVRKEALESLRIFDNIRFEPTEHKYWFEGEDIKPEELISATTLVGTLHKPFESDFWATKKAKERGCTKEMILEEWDRKAKRACDKGTLVHYYMECNLSGKEFEIPAELNREEIVHAFEKTKPAADRFLAVCVNSGDLKPIRSEVKVGLPEWKIVGTIDQLFVDRNGKIWIYDWKTNGRFTLENKWQKLLEPFGELQDTNLNAYSIQLSIYRLILEYIGIPIEGCELVWLNEETGAFQEFKCLDFRKKAKMLIESRLKKSEKILLEGAPKPIVEV